MSKLLNNFSYVIKNKFSSLTSSFKRDKNTIFELTRKQIKTQYRDSTLGFLWTILNPLLNMLVMWLVFSQFFGKGDPYYPIYLLTGNILFSALRNATVQSLQSIVNNRSLLLRTKIEPFVFPVSNVFASIVNFAFSLIALVPFMIWLSIQQQLNLFSYQLVFILFLMPAFLLFEYGIGLFLSAIYVFFRDIKHIYGVFLTLWNYITPVFYKITNMDGFANTIIKLNPMYHFVTYFRECVYMGAVGVDSVTEFIYDSAYIPVWATLGWCYLSALISVVIGTVVFKLLKNQLITRI